MNESTELAALRVKATAGDVYAQVELGVAYALGEGVPQDDAQAAALYRKAADQGDAGAQCNLGLMYANGEGVPQDYVEAVSWYRQAADQGDAFAQFNLGNAYYSGWGVPQDYVEAHKWRNLAASRTSTENRKRYGDARDEVAEKMTPQQIADAQQRATDWLTEFEQRN